MPLVAQDFGVDSDQRIEQSWIHALRQLLSKLSPTIDAGALRRLGQEAADLAWRADRPTPATVSHLPMRYRRVLVSDPQCAQASALLISWPPGHRTALHDHDGLWGAELVLDGGLAVDEYRKTGEPAAAEASFQRTQVLGIGDAAVFADPAYLYVCRNLSDDQPALTLHIYGGPLRHYTFFQPDADGHLRSHRTVAKLDGIWESDRH